MPYLASGLQGVAKHSHCWWPCTSGMRSVAHPPAAGSPGLKRLGADLEKLDVQHMDASFPEYGSRDWLSRLKERGELPAALRGVKIRRTGLTAVPIAEGCALSHAWDCMLQGAVPRYATVSPGKGGVHVKVDRALSWVRVCVLSSSSQEGLAPSALLTPHRFAR